MGRSTHSFAVLTCDVCFLTAEVGDYCEEFAEQDYLSSMKLLPNQTRAIESQIVAHHKEHEYVFKILYQCFHCGTELLAL